VLAVRSVPASRLVALGLVAASIAATSLLLVEPFDGPYQVLAVVGVAFGALGLVLAIERLRRWLRVGTVLVLSGGLLVGSALAPARSSDDLWAYAMYGRIVVDHHANPYVQPPSAYPHDPLLKHVNLYWRGATARYGPVFIGVTAAVAALAGDRALPTRLAYQMLAALSMFLALVLIARHTRSAAAVAVLGLNPVTGYMVVNGGHNDALVGLAVLVGVLLASHDRRVPATLAFTGAALVKATAGLALLAYLAWLAYRRGPRALLRSVGVAMGVTLPLLLLFGLGNVIEPVFSARESVLPHSPWNLLTPGGVTKSLALDGDEYSFGSLGHLSTVALIAIGVVVAILVVSRLKEPTPLFAVAGALLAYLFLSLYTAPWFAAWVLPLLALCWRWRVSLWALAFFAVLMIDDRFGDAVYAQALRENSARASLGTWVNTLAMLAAVAGAVALVRYRHTDPSPGTSPSRSLRASVGQRRS
jgi:hypothetical protein